MCDYSLEMYKSRQAAVGDQLILRRFPSSSKGFVRKGEEDCATCIKDGVQLQVTMDGVPRIGEYCRLESQLYRDGLLFKGDNLPISIQALPEGTEAMVTMIGAPGAETIGEVIAPAARELEIVRP